MAKVVKPTAQQKAQAKARAGGNNAIKVTNKDLKKLGKVALVAASVTPVGRGVKAASMAVKAGKTAKAAKAASKAKEAANTARIAKNSVKLKERDSITRLQANVRSYYKTVKAKSGATAREDAIESAKNIKQNLGKSKPGIVKINSNKK